MFTCSHCGCRISDYDFPAMGPNGEMWCAADCPAKNLAKWVPPKLPEDRVFVGYAEYEHEPEYCGWRFREEGYENWESYFIDKLFGGLKERSKVRITVEVLEQP